MPFIPRDAAYIENRSIPEPNSGCWLWTAGLDPTGYGKMLFEGACTTASRASFLIHGGEVPAGYEVDHLCFTRACVNPSHLRAISRRANRAAVRPDVGTPERTRKGQRRVTHCHAGHPRPADLVGKHCPSCRRISALRYKAEARSGTVIAMEA